METKTYGSITITDVMDGQNGDPGRGVKSEAKLYYQSASDKQIPKTPDEAPELAQYWTSDFPTEWSSNIYIWVITKTEWTVGDPIYTYTTPILMSQIEAATLSAQLSEKSLSDWCADNNITIIDGSTIVAGSISADKIDVDNLSAISANLGTVTSGEIKSPDYERHGVAVWDSENDSESDSESLAYTLSDDGTYYSVSGIGTCTDTDVVIPDYYNELPITNIGEFAFENCLNITSVTIGNNVTTIGIGAFVACNNLISVTIPDSVTSIGEGAFAGCDNLVNIIIPEGVDYVGDCAIPMDNKIIIIYCKAESQPEGWHNSWNPSGRPVYYYSETAPTTEGNYWHYKDTEGFKISCNDEYLIDSRCFKVTPEGDIVVNRGSIAGWDVNGNRIYKDTILLNTDNSFKIPVLKEHDTPWPEYSTVGIAAGYDYYEGTEKVVSTYSAGATVELAYDTSIGAYTNTNAVYLQLPFIYNGVLSDNRIQVELEDIWLLWNNAHGLDDEYLIYASTGATGYIDSSKIEIYSQTTGTLLLPVGSIISDMTKKAFATTRIRLKCKVKLTFNGEQYKYLSAPLKITHDGEVLANKIITMDNPMVLTSSAFERAGGGGNRLEMSSDVWRWYSETDSVGANIGTSILGGYVYSSFGSNIIKFYPILDPDNFSLDTWGNKYPAVDLFMDPTFIGNSNGVDGKTDPCKDIQFNGIAVRANGGWQFTNSVKFKEDVQFNGDVKDSNGAIIHTSDCNAKNSIESQPEIYSKLFDKFNPVIFKYNNGTSGRYHMGLIAQEVESAMAELGMSSNDFAALCYKEDEDGNKSDYGLRYTELISMCIKEIQDLKARVEELENKLNTTQND